MSKDRPSELGDSLLRKHHAKSTDLKRRLFEVGLAGSPPSHPTLTQTIASPKRLLARHIPSFGRKEEEHLIKFQPPSHSPQLMKTGKDFQIRKSPKASKNAQEPLSHTLSNFYKQDAIRDDPIIVPSPSHSPTVRIPSLSSPKSRVLKTRLLQNAQSLPPPTIQQPQSRLDQYVRLVLRGVDHIDEFLYLVRGKQQNIYQLQLVQFQIVRENQGEPGFEYYTVSKKGFCQYVGGKPHAFLDIGEWAQQKTLYLKIKALKFFYRFRRWKTLQMWRRTITKQRREAIAHSLGDRLFLLETTARNTLLQLRKLTLEMERSVLIIAKNEGAYTLESFKHCQERARREASLAVQEYSRQSRAVVRKCFQGRLSQLRQNIKRKAGQEKTSIPHSSSAQSPKESAFQALGFPSKMSYEHRSRLRKEAGRFLRFSYLVDSLHLSCLAGLYAGQVASFISRLEQAQLMEGVRLRAGIQDGKEDADRERMFVLQLACNFKEVPARLITDGEGGEEWSPMRDIRLRGQERGGRPWVPRLCQHWLSMQPALDDVLDELSFLLREGLGSLKCFQRWARHRQMQKYVSILEEWDDLVSQNWQISENDNLDPLLLLDSLDPALTKLKLILKTTENKLLDATRSTLTDLLNAYWHYSQLPLDKLQSQALSNPAETFEQFLIFTSRLLQRVTNDLPHRIELGVVTVQVTRIKTTLGQKFAGVLQSLRGKLPELVEERTALLNGWLTAFGGRLREEILNIDDFVRVVGVIKQVEGQFGQRREECNELAQLYQTMQVFRMDTRRRKQFQTITLKLKDQLEQLLITAQQNIERKADLYTREVLKYHLPTLVRDINKALENVEQPRFLRLDSFRSAVKDDLAFLQSREKQLQQQRAKCDDYMTALKIQGQSVGELNELSRQITSRVELWKTLQEWELLSKEYQGQIAKNLPLGILLQTVQEYRNTLQSLEEVLPPNEILQFLKQSVKEWYIYLPLLSGFAQPLSDTHWNQIYQALPQKYSLDLKRREFTLIDFLRSGIGSYAKEIQAIFEKCRVQAQLQRQYQALQDAWLALLAKIRPEGRFTVIANGEALRAQLDTVVGDVARLLANPHAQSLKQYSITYDSVFAAQEALQGWLSVQDRIVEVQKQCRLLDIKKLPDYNYFQNAERLYKQASKAMTNKGAQSGVRLGKLLTTGVEQKLAEIQTNLSRVQQNIRGILRDHRRIFPSFYLFSDEQLLHLITEQSHQSLQWAARRLFPVISRLQFQNQRISSIISIDEDRLIKNPISVNSQVQQILFQIGQTCCQLSRRALRACRYKAVENNLSGLVEQYNIQHLLAISRVDFSHYTTISIDNQQETPDSLSQFRKVMRKDTAEDIKNRSLKLVGYSEGGEEGGTLPRKGYLQKYDTLLLQQLLYEEILDLLIKSNIQRSEEFPWASQLKFFWEDTPSDDPNITVRQLHLALKYGSEFVGSRSRVVLQSQSQALLGLRLSQFVVYNGSRYNLERLANAVGYKLAALPCNQLTTEHSLRQFLIGCHFADFLPFLIRADQLPFELLSALPGQRWVQEFKGGQLKRNSPYLKQAQKGQAVFLNVREATTGWQALQGKMRVVHYLPPRKELLRCGMRLRGVFSEERTSLLLRVFEAVGFLEERSRLQGVSLQEFLDELLQSGQEVEEHSLFQRVLRYLQPKITLEAHAALTKHAQSLALLPFNDQDIYNNKGNTKLDAIFECLSHRNVLILTGRGHSKKYFVKKQAEKRKIEVVQLSAEGMTTEELFGCQADGEKVKIQSIFSKLAMESQQRLMYFQSVTPQLLLSLQALLFSGQSPTSYPPNLKILLQIPSPQKFITPRELTTFPTLSFQSPREYISAIIGQWLLSIKQEEKQRTVSRVLLQVILPTIQNLSGKQELLLQQRTLSFLQYLSSLGSFKNALQAALYTLITMFRGCEQEQLKLQYLVKKHLGEEKLGQGVKIGNLFYRQSPLQDKLVTDKEYMKIWMEENQGFRDETYLLTPALLHALTLARRGHENTELPLFIYAPANAGKTALFALYRRLHHENSFYMQVSPAQGKLWSAKLTSSLQRHGLSSLGARINYRQSVILVQDVHLAQRSALLPLELMLFYGRCRTQQKDYQLRNVKFMLSGESMPEKMQRSCLRIALQTTRDELTSIFTDLLKRNVEKEWDLNELLLQKIAVSTLQVCLKIVAEQNSMNKEGFSAARRIISGFGKLKIKEGLPVQKEIQKFWAFSLLQAIKPYDRLGEIQGQLRKLDLNTYSPSILSFTHLCFKTQRKIQPLKDPKRLYNLLNEKIEKYNQSDTKRYGESFEFINFDAVLEKIVTISHSLLLDADYLLVGRRGTGKEALVKLAAFFNGLFYRPVKGSIKTTLLQLIEASGSAPHLLYKSISTSSDTLYLHQYTYCDFQSEILSRSEGKPRAGTREKEKTVHMKSVHKNMIATDNYIVPKAKLTCQEVMTYRRAFRLVAAVSSLKEARSLSVQVRSKFHLDLMEEVPSPSIMQYNEKLLSVDGVTCNRDAQLLLSQIFQHSRQKLGLSLRSNDDCVRLFSSFLANLVNQMVLQEERYCKVLDLLTRLNNCYSLINQEVARLHGKLKEISLNTQGNKQTKQEIEAQLREKSTAQSVSQKLTEILTWLQPLYSSRLAGIKLNLDNREILEMTFALTASYFIYLSNTPYEERRQQLSAWYRDIPLLSKVRPIGSFLSLFLLYQEQFNAEPVDHLPQFYENMSIIFHSAKPIAIRDVSARGRLWLQKNCSFLYLKEEQKDFSEVIKESLGRSSNILIQVTQQDSLDHIAQSLVGTLLFLPESVGNVTIKGEEVQIHPQAKVYLLLKEGLRLPKELQQEFTVVLFEESEALAKSALVHEYLSYTQREPHLMKLDYARKIRSLRLDCENAIGQVADSIYEQLCGNDLPPQQHTLVERLGKITDKLMVRAQNQFTKIREKEELMRDLQDKTEKAEGRTVYPPAQNFYYVAKGIRRVLSVMAQSSLGYTAPSYAEYFSTLRLLLSKGTISSVPSLILATLRQWGPMYRPQHYQIFAFLLIMAGRGRPLEDFLSVMTEEGVRSSFLLSLIGKEGELLRKEEHLPQVLSSALIDLFKEEEFRSIGPLLSSKETSDLPLLWKEEQGQNNEFIRVTSVRGAMDLLTVRQKIQSIHPKLLEPSQDDTLQSLLKKTPHEQVQIFVTTAQSLKQAERVIRGWSLIDKATVFLYNPKGEITKGGNKHVWWEMQMENDQGIFTKVIEFYLRSVKVEAEQRQAKEGKEETISIPNQISAVDPPVLSFTGMSFTHHSQQSPPFDPLYHLLQKFTTCLQWKYQSLSLPPPCFSQKELRLFRKSIDSDNPMSLPEKITLMLHPLHAVLHAPAPDIPLYAKTLESKLVKLTAQCFTEEEFYKEAQSVLAEGDFLQKEIGNGQGEKAGLRLQLGWLIRTRAFFGLSNQTILSCYLKQVQQCISSCLIYSQAPKVTRGSKRQPNIKNRRESMNKKPIGRQSQSLGKRLLMKAPAVRVASSPLASLYLLKETEYFQQILYKIHRDLQKAKTQILSLPSTPITEKTLTILTKIFQDQPIPDWKCMLFQVSCAGVTLSLSMRSILARRNELFTYYNKFSVSESCELDFRYVRHPAEFLRAYFRSELNHQDTFMLSTALTVEEAERGEYLRVNGMWGQGWRLTPQGVVQNIGENKPIQLSGCFIVKKIGLGVAMNPVDLYASPQDRELLMRVYAMSKKSQGGPAIKLYLRCE